MVCPGVLHDQIDSSKLSATFGKSTKCVECFGFSIRLSCTGFGEIVFRERYSSGGFGNWSTSGAYVATWSIDIDRSDHIGEDSFAEGFGKSGKSCAATGEDGSGVDG
jgi:hypothetical protein